MFMDLVSLSFWSYYPVASGTAELILNVFFFSPAKSIPHFVFTEYGGTDIYCFLNFSKLFTNSMSWIIGSCGTMTNCNVRTICITFQNPNFKYLKEMVACCLVKDKTDTLH